MDLNTLQLRERPESVKVMKFHQFNEIEVSIDIQQACCMIESRPY